MPTEAPGPDAPPTDGPNPDTPPAHWTGLTPGDGSGDPFGGAIATSGDTLLVAGGWGATATSAAYVFVRRDGLWVEQARLTAAGGAQHFGRRVAISGDTAAIVATRPGATDGPALAEVQVFERRGADWTHAATLDADDLGTTGSFGASVALDGDTLAIGNVGTSIHVFTRTGGVWSEQAPLLPPLERHGWSFGDALALDGDTLVVGDRAGWNQPDDAATGLAHVYVRHGARWSLETTLAPTFVDVWPQPIAFGASVAVRGDRAVIGVSRGYPCSYALVFERRDAAWAEAARLDSGHNVCGSIASLSLAIGDGAIALGAGGTGGDFASSGAAYVHVLGDGGWTERSPGPLPVRAPLAGSAIALTATSVLLGAPEFGTVFEYPLQ